MAAIRKAAVVPADVAATQNEVQAKVLRSIALVCFLILPGLSLAQLPALQSPGFDSAGPNELPAGWRGRVSFAEGKATVDATEKRSGAGCLRVDLPRHGGYLISQGFGPVTCDQLSFGCWVKTKLNGSDGVQLSLHWLDDSGQIVGTGRPSALASGSAAWQQLVVVGERPVGATKALLKISVGQGLGTGGTAWVDDAFVRPGVDVGGALLNLGFELDADGDGDPDGWRPFVHGGGFALARDVTASRSGQSSARLVGYPGHGDRSCYGQVSRPCTPPQGVRLRFWYKGSGECSGFVRFRPAPGVKLESGEFYDTMGFGAPLPKGEWTELAFEAKTPAAALAAKQVQVEVTIYQRGEGTLWLDDVSVEGLW